MFRDAESTAHQGEAGTCERVQETRFTRGRGRGGGWEGRGRGRGGRRFHLQRPIDGAEGDGQEARQQRHGVATSDAQRVHYRPAYRTRPLLHTSLLTGDLEGERANAPADSASRKRGLQTMNQASGHRSTYGIRRSGFRHTLTSRTELPQLQLLLSNVALLCTVRCVQRSMCKTDFRRLGCNLTSAHSQNTEAGLENRL